VTEGGGNGKPLKIFDKEIISLESCGKHMGSAEVEICHLLFALSSDSDSILATSASTPPRTCPTSGSQQKYFSFKFIKNLLPLPVFIKNLFPLSVYCKKSPLFSI